MEAKMRNGSFAMLDPYAEPKDVDYVVNQYFLEENKMALLSLPSIFQLNPKVRWRAEYFGVVVFLGPKFVCYLNGISAKLLQSLSADKTYQLRDFSDYCNLEVEKFLARLYDKRILISDES